jgi:hypothetical protein
MGMDDGVRGAATGGAMACANGGVMTALAYGDTTMERQKFTRRSSLACMKMTKKILEEIGIR